jgi:exodeoxyribonuclease-1
MVPLLAHPSNPNEIICFNLRFSPEPLLALDAETICQRLYTPTLDLPAGEERLPLKGIHLNKSPALAPINTLTPEMADKWQIDWGLVKTHFEMLMADSKLISTLQDVYQQPRAFDDVDADAALYDGFISSSDRRRCQQLLETPANELANWPADHFEDPRLRTLLFRYRARNYPQTLSEEEASRWHRFCQSRLIDGEFGASLTAEQFQQQLLTLAQRESGAREQDLLDELSAWAQQLFA